MKSLETVHIQMQKTPEAFVRKYISTKIGFNIRLGHTTKNDDGTWTIQLKAVVPSYVKLENERSKTFAYVFHDVGEAIVKYDEKEYDYDFVLKPKATELDLILMKKIDKLTTDVQQEILNYGRYSWGNLSKVKWWLGTVHKIILRCLKDESFPSDELPERYQRYFELLRANKWIRIESGNKPKVIADNKLKKLEQELLSENKVKHDLNSVTDALVGILFAEHYVQLRDEFKIPQLTSYVTTTKAYYADAVREGRAIHMSESTLLNKFRTYNYSPKPSTFKGFNFPDTVAELVSNRFLKYSKDDERFITANPELLELLLPYQSTLAQIVIDN